MTPQHAWPQLPPLCLPWLVPMPGTLPCSRAAGSFAPCAWGPLPTTCALPSLSSPFHLTEMPPSLEGSPASLSWLETRKCWMHEGLKKVRIKPNPGAMPPLWWGKAQPHQKGARDLSSPINW